MKFLRSERGFAMVAVLSVLLVLTVLSALVLYVSGKEIRLGAARRLGSQSIYIAEGGGFAARSALMVLVNEDPSDIVSIDSSLTGTILNTWYAAGTTASQNPLALFDYFLLDGLRYSIAPSSATSSVSFEVDWSLAQTHRKLRVATGTPPANPLGTGNYKAIVVVAKRLAPHPTDGAQPNRYIQRLTGQDFYEFFYTYTITSDGETDPRSRRRVILSGEFSLRVRHQNFAQYALFTHVHTTPSGGAIWFTNRTSFDGPVHTNGQFRFAYFPKFSDRLTSVSTSAWFNNDPGSPVNRTANENVVGGVRRDAPVQFDATPLNNNDDQDNLPANFTRGVPPITVPPNSYNQRAISIGRDPADLAPNTWTTGQWNTAIRQSIPELVDDATAIPTGIYVPVTNPDGDLVSDVGDPLMGGIYVQGDLSSMTMSTAGGGNLALYTMVQGGQTVTVTVDRISQTTAVYNSAWGAPTTRVFPGVPKGWQSDPGNENAGVVYVRGNILGLSGTLEEKEQTTVTASGRIDITNHILYEDPPDLSDPTDNPLNVLGLYSATNDVRITTAAPNDLTIHAVLMAGQPGVSDGYNSSVFVQNYNSGAPRGTVNMVGGLIEEYYGAFGTFDPDTGAALTGYGRNFQFDRRLGRGIAPPFFPTSTLFEVVNGDDRMAGVRPIWRESTP